MATVLELPTGFRREVAGRLRQALAARNIKKGDVAKAIGMNLTSFSKRVNGHLPIDVDEADQIAAASGINRAWLLTGQGPMFDPDLSGSVPESLLSGSNGRPLAYLVRPRPALVPVPTPGQTAA